MHIHPTWLVPLALLVGACTPTTDLPESSQPPTYGSRGRVATTRGSSLAVTFDDRVAVATNRTDGVVTVMRMDPAHATEPADLLSNALTTELPFHPLNESQPWASVIGADDDTAYVVLRGLKQVARISGLHAGEPRETGRVPVGSEPTGIAISPSGSKVYVANWGEGTISVILTSDLSTATWDLNLRLARTGLLGPLLTTGGASAGSAVWGDAELQAFRPGLAHPRALVMTDDGDVEDDDEMLYATEFFAQPVADVSVTNPDVSHMGVVYPILVGRGGGNPPLDEETQQPLGVIPLSPIADTKFLDGEGKPTGCFPNQLYAAAMAGTRLLVTSMCSSPTGPVEPGLDGEFANNNFKTLAHPAVFVIDTVTHRQVPTQTILLTQALGNRYGPDDHDQRMPLIPNDIAVTAEADAGTRVAYVTALGASAVFPIQLAEDGSLVDLGSSGQRFISLGQVALPTGLSLLRSRPWALTLSDRKPDVALLDLDQARKVAQRQSVVTDWRLDPDTRPEEIVPESVREGRRLFATGLGAWSFSGQAWSSCESCHPDGLSDGVAWRFPRGPRRTISTAGTYYRDAPERRLLLWTANGDEVHDVEGIARNTSGGVGGVVWNPYAEVPHKNCRLVYDGKAPLMSDDSPACKAQKVTTDRLTGLNGSLGAITVESPGGECSPNPPDAPCDINGSTDWDNIDAFIRSVRAPRAPTTLDRSPMGRVATGERLFRESRCAACHGGPGWTIAKVFYTPGVEANGALPSADPSVADPSYVADAATLRAMQGSLRANSYVIPPEAPPEFALLNPAAASGPAAFRTAPPRDADAATQLKFLYTNGVGAGDQLNCALRWVGTFPAADDPELATMTGRVAPGAPPVTEVRRVKNPPDATLDPGIYADQLAFGQTGFNIPSLMGLAVSGSFFHGGNARTLEELFDPTFVAHHASMLPGFEPTAADIQALVSYLLSIDESDEAALVEVPSSRTGEFPFDPDLCAQLAAGVTH